MDELDMIAEAIENILRIARRVEFAAPAFGICLLVSVYHVRSRDTNPLDYISDAVSAFIWAWVLYDAYKETWQ